VLSSAASALDEAGHWAEIVDDEWRYLYMTRELRLSLGGLSQLAAVPLGEHYFSSAAMAARATWRSGPNTIETGRQTLAQRGGMVLADTPGGRDELRRLVAPELRDVVDTLTAVEPTAVWSVTADTFETAGIPSSGWLTACRLIDDDGRLAGTALILKPAAPMSVIGVLAAASDLRHLERMRHVVQPARRPSAILFADLEASSPLARRLSTAGYFALSRRLARAADRCIIDAGGLVGRHTGDGVVAYFLADIAGTESTAARGCIAAARALRGAVDEVVARSELPSGDVVLRFGLHWGSTLYVGQITTSGRSEVTALGDEVNEAARIEACATGGRALASKALVERLEAADAHLLGLDLEHIGYTPLGQLPTATDKARRDAPAIAVCEV
jgi:class 3 adenylate cyclase